MLEWVLNAARAAGCEHIYVVVGHGADAVQSEIEADDVTWVLQEEQLGTGHALLQVESHLEAPATLLVLSGDVPLVAPETLDRLAAAAHAGWGSMVVAEMEEPGSLGRVVATASGTLERIVEVADATPEELENPWINAGIYALPAPEIFDFLKQLKPNNAKQELYLTDALTGGSGSVPRPGLAGRGGRGLRSQRPAGPGSRPRCIATTQGGCVDERGRDDSGPGPCGHRGRCRGW